MRASPSQPFNSGIASSIIELEACFKSIVYELNFLVENLKSEGNNIIDLYIYGLYTNDFFYPDNSDCARFFFRGCFDARSRTEVN